MTLSLDGHTMIALGEAAKFSPVYHDKRFPPSLYYRFLRVLASAKRPLVSVELGVCGGGGSLHLALGHPEGKVYGVDVANQWPDNIDHVQQTCPNFIFIREDSKQFAKGMMPNAFVDILFIDTVHTYEATLAEFEAWQPKLARNAVVVLDDLFRVGMDKAWAELPGEKIRMDYLHIGGSPTDGGFGVILI